MELNHIKQVIKRQFYFWKDIQVSLLPNDVETSQPDHFEKVKNVAHEQMRTTKLHCMHVYINRNNKRNLKSM